MSGDKVVPFVPPRPKVPADKVERNFAWVCWCGGAEMKLLEGGDIECWQCGQIQSVRHFNADDEKVPS